MTDPSSGLNDCDGMAAYGNPFRWPSGGVPDQYCRVDSFWYWNLNLSYDINKELQLRLAVTNLFNQQAPVDVGGLAGTGDNRNSSIRTRRTTRRCIGLAWRVPPGSSASPTTSTGRSSGGCGRAALPQRRQPHRPWPTHCAGLAVSG